MYYYETNDGFNTRKVFANFAYWTDKMSCMLTFT
jgi:hypothetical protein